MLPKKTEISQLHSAIKGRVIIYSISGNIIQELDKTLFRRPFRVAQNKLNNDLYITDRNDAGDFSLGKVVAFDRAHIFRYEYTGSHELQFAPVDVCTDESGHVLITDMVNDSVHILDKDGQFLTYLLTRDQGLSRSYFIDVDRDGNAWVGEFYGDILITKYLQ